MNKKQLICCSQRSTTTSRNLSTKTKKRQARTLDRIEDNITIKKQLSKRMLQFFCQLQEEDGRENVTTGPVVDKQTNKDSVNTKSTSNMLEINIFLEDDNSIIENEAIEIYATSHRSKRASSKNASLKLKKLANIENVEDINSLAALTMVEVLTLSPTSNIFDEIISKNNDNDHTSVSDGRVGGQSFFNAGFHLELKVDRIRSVGVQ